MFRANRVKVRRNKKTRHEMMQIWKKGETCGEYRDQNSKWIRQEKQRKRI